MDDNVSGYFYFTDGGKTEKHMPLAKDPGALSINEKDQPVLTEQGDTCEAIALENRWNFDKGYPSILKNIHLCWSYNGFPNFAIDVLGRVNAELDVKNENVLWYVIVSHVKRITIG